MTGEDEKLVFVVQDKEALYNNKLKYHHDRNLIENLWKEVKVEMKMTALKPRMKSHYRGHKMAIWLNLIPQLHQPGDQDVSMRHHHFHERASHFYAGAVRPESFTRAPPTTLTPDSGGEPLECPPNSTSDEPLGLSGAEEAEELERHFYSTSTALGVTLGIGCLLLLLNALIFSAIYYQRRKKKKRWTEPEAVEMKERKPPPPTPPLRTSSVPVTPATVKKRVQIQEISV